ncbi:PRC-barrel domain containing protein [Actinophytocola sp.]|uniref:PRC-barrel domain containing protein n=1 Tax=Actinophytocola sp. TaxID=1872138 RepID=UPI002ED8D0E1
MNVPDDLGRPIAYTVLREGTPVHDPAGARVGVVEHVVADDVADIFEGLVVHTVPLPGRHLFADADQIAALHERGVLLAVPREELHDPDPARPRPEREDEPEEEPVESPLEARLRRAWDWLTAHLGSDRRTPP